MSQWQWEMEGKATR